MCQGPNPNRRRSHTGRGWVSRTSDIPGSRQSWTLTQKTSERRRSSDGRTATGRDRIESFLLTWRDQPGSRITAIYGKLPTANSGQLLLVDGVPGVSMAIEKRALTASKAVKADR